MLLPILPTRETCVLIQDGVGKFPEVLSRPILSYAIGRETVELSPSVHKLATIYDERAFGASMTGVKLLDTFVLQVDQSRRCRNFHCGGSSVQEQIRRAGEMTARLVSDSLSRVQVSDLCVPEDGRLLKRPF